MTESFHTHTDERGFLIRCYHKTRLSWKFWLVAGWLSLFTFPVEHLIWVKVPPFNMVAEHFALVHTDDEDDHDDD